MKFKNPFKTLTKFEFGLWLTSIVVVSCSFLLSKGGDYLTLLASLIGVTSLIFVAKGYVFGQAMIVVFAVLYGIVSFKIGYYGEMITYVGMSAPIALINVFAWLKHPYKKEASADVKSNDSGATEVKVSRLTPKKFLIIVLLTSVVTFAFYFILKALGTANLLFSTISVATSFLAASLSFVRTPYYALGYASNDIVLIILWLLASIKDIAYLPMILCFVMFLANDLYGFYNWRRMKKRQESDSNAV